MTTECLPRLDRLVDAVQTNCHIADAGHAADMTLCIYLLQMREFYRWEHGIAPLQPLPHAEVGTWLAAREALWETLDGAPYSRLPVAGDWLDPFDTVAINARLNPLGLVYGAGHSAPGRASFVLGALEQAAPRAGIELLVCGCEHARGLASPPAVLAGDTVLLRREAFARWVWEKFEAWTLKRQPGAFKSALDAHGFERVGSLAVERLINTELESLLMHELGEHRAGRQLGVDWQALRGRASRRADLHLRALRDHLADCLVTLPTLLARRAEVSLHFWFANLEGVRAGLFPRLLQAQAAWQAGAGQGALHAAVDAGAVHWGRACDEVLALHRALGDDAAAPIEAFVTSPERVF